MTALLDANVLIALVVTDHVHHSAAEEWYLANEGTGFATCPTTEGALVRFLIRANRGPDEARAILGDLHATPGHDFWTDDVPFTEVALDGVIGHRQVTDAYLAALARARRRRVATFDRGLAQHHPDAAELVATA